MVLLGFFIDDFAFKKRYSYGTIMVVLDSHRIIDILNSRDKEPAIEWLRNYPNIETVSRDGSRIYASAITEAHPKAIQIGYRFHYRRDKFLFTRFTKRPRGSKNSVIYSYSNGLAEGSVNKLQVINRIMYGRNSFELF